MKKQLMLGMALAALLTACNQNSGVVPDNQTTVASARGGVLDGFGKGTAVTQDKLPQPAQDYLTKTYPGYTFVQGMQGTGRNGSTFFAVVIGRVGFGIICTSMPAVRYCRGVVATVVLVRMKPTRPP